MNVTINVGIVGNAGEQHCTCVYKFISCKWMNIMTDKIWYRQNVEIRNSFLWPAERTSFRHWAHEWWRLLTGVSLVLEFISWNICCSAASDSKSAVKSSTAILFKSFSIQNGGGKLNHICTDGYYDSRPLLRFLSSLKCSTSFKGYLSFCDLFLSRAWTTLV